ncbi:MAG: Sua5/YciO/YrdC/YwlC family protein [Parcubacteria group bacterium GW2011_GWA1_36_12]|nr:MAG: Sua5/YciO/YrdC/YwlC family protein [Parcubacteria group bacterium GW2011_GWA1_36_12]
MVKILTKSQIIEMEKFYINEIKSGKIFIYPTDTIYGIGCDATNDKAVQKIREIKQRETKPFSVIAPNKQWIKDNCFVNEITENWLNKLPGPYTLILKLKNKKAVSEAVTSTNTIGVRIPAHWFAKIIEKTKVPFITTSVNISGEPNLKSIKDLKKEIENNIDYFVNEGEINNSPSTIINLTEKEEIIKR